MFLAIKEEDSEADRPSGMSRKHRIHSRFYWFTEFCNSQCLSHFAAPFISVQAKTFITEGCKMIEKGRIPQWNEEVKVCDSREEQMQHNEYAIHPTLTALESPQEAPDSHPSPREASQTLCTMNFWMHANDPSAGSPTETLLRLLLPLSDKVH